MTRQTTTDATEIEHQIGSAGELLIKVADWDVQLLSVDGDTVRARLADGRPLPTDLEVVRSPSNLTLRQIVRHLGLGFGLSLNRRSTRLLIDVPAGTSTSIQTASGDVQASGLRGEQRFRSASGDVALDSVSGDVIAETVSGDVRVRIEGTVVLALKTVSGDASVDGGRVERINLGTTSGDVRVTSELGAGPHAIETLSGDATLVAGRGVRVTARTVAGDLRSDLPHTSEGGPGRRTLVVGDGATEVQFRSVSGDLRIVDPARAEAIAPPPAPMAPSAPMPPAAPMPPLDSTPADAVEPDPSEPARLEILRALERGEIDITEAGNRLAALDESTRG
jgi:hypothetical protein